MSETAAIVIVGLSWFTCGFCLAAAIHARWTLKLTKGAAEAAAEANRNAQQERVRAELVAGQYYAAKKIDDFITTCEEADRDR